LGHPKPFDAVGNEDYEFANYQDRCTFIILWAHIALKPLYVLYVKTLSSGWRRMKPFGRSRDHLARISQANGDLDDDDKSPTLSAVNVIQMFNSDQNPLSPTLPKYLLYTQNGWLLTSDPSLPHSLDN